MKTWALAAAALIGVFSGYCGSLVTIDGRGVTHVDGKPFFMVGIWSVRANDVALMKGSFNTIVNPYGAKSPEKAAPYLKACADNGLYLIAGLETEAVRNGDTAGIQAYAKAIADHPALLAWISCEEPKWKKLRPEHAKGAYDALMQADVRHPIGFVDYELKNVKTFAGAYDFYGFDQYPIGMVSVKWWRDNRLGPAMARSPKPTWLTLQTFGQETKHWVWPTAGEMRTMAYVAINREARGIMSYAFNASSFKLTDRPEFWAEVKKLHRELLENGNEFLAPVVAGGVVSEDEDDDVDCSLRRLDDGSYLLIAANLACGDKQPDKHYPGLPRTDVTLRLPGIKSANVELVGSAGVGSGEAGRTLQVRKGQLVDSFDPYAVHLYRITLNRPARR